MGCGGEKEFGRKKNYGPPDFERRIEQWGWIGIVNTGEWWSFASLWNWDLKKKKSVGSGGRGEERRSRRASFLSFLYLPSSSSFRSKHVSKMVCSIRATQQSIG